VGGLVPGAGKSVNVTSFGADLQVGGYSTKPLLKKTLPFTQNPFVTAVNAGISWLWNEQTRAATMRLFVLIPKLRWRGEEK